MLILFSKLIVDITHDSLGAMFWLTHPLSWFTLFDHFVLDSLSWNHSLLPWPWKIIFKIYYVIL